MAVLYVTEFSNIGTSQNASPLSMAAQPPVAESTVVIGAGSLQSPVFNGQTKFVRIHTDAVCSIAFGTNPTATATNARMAAGSTEYFTVIQGGAAQRVAVITNT